MKVCLFVLLAALNLADTRPNIIWICIEDWSADLSCYGTKGIHTSPVDKLASEGIRYENAFTTSPVCSTSRSAMMTGFHQNCIRAHQHRTHEKKPLPHGIKPVPHLFLEAGYYTAIMTCKTDCSFVPNIRDELFTGTDWKERKEGQSFFARVTFGGTHRSWNRAPQRPISTKDVELPPAIQTTNSFGATGPIGSSKCNSSVVMRGHFSRDLRTRTWQTTPSSFSSVITGVVTFAVSRFYTMGAFACP